MHNLENEIKRIMLNILKNILIAQELRFDLTKIYDINKIPIVSYGDIKYDGLTFAYLTDPNCNIFIIFDEELSTLPKTIIKLFINYKLVLIQDCLSEKISLVFGKGVNFYEKTLSVYELTIYEEELIKSINIDFKYLFEQLKLLRIDKHKNINL